MRRIGPVVLSCVVLCGVFAGPGLATEVSALEILNKSFDPLTKQLEFELRNSSEKVITAWRLSLARSDGHGHAQKSILDQDLLMSPLDPGETMPGRRRLEIGDEEDGRTALSVKVTAVVFADLSYEGDTEAAETILEARAARVEEIGAVLDTLEVERQLRRSRQAWQATLRLRAQALRKQGKESQESDDSHGQVAAQRSVTRVELAEWLEAVGDEMAVAVDPNGTLDELTTGLREQYEKGRRALPDQAENGRAQKGGKGGGQ